MIADINRMPPGEQAFEVYRIVTIEGRPVAQAAAELALSVTRVVQLRDQVIEWLARATPVDHLTPEQRLAAGERIAAERMQFLYAEAVQAWRDSKGAEPQAAFLQQALAILVALAKFPARPPVAREREATDDAPPVRDCSGSLLSRGGKPAGALVPEVATRFSAECLAEQEERRAAFLAALEADANPAHPALSASVMPAEGGDSGLGEPTLFELAADRRLSEVGGIAVRRSAGRQSAESRAASGRAGAGARR